MEQIQEIFIKSEDLKEFFKIPTDYKVKSFSEINPGSSTMSITFNKGNNSLRLTEDDLLKYVSKSLKLTDKYNIRHTSEQGIWIRVIKSIEFVE